MEKNKEIENANEYRRLTPERVRKQKGLEHLTDEQIEKLIRTLEAISIMHVDIFLKEHRESVAKAKSEKKKK